MARSASCRPLPCNEFTENEVQWLRGCRGCGSSTLCPFGEKFAKKIWRVGSVKLAPCCRCTCSIKCASRAVDSVIPTTTTTTTTPTEDQSIPSELDLMVRLEQRPRCIEFMLVVHRAQRDKGFPRPKKKHKTVGYVLVEIITASVKMDFHACIRGMHIREEWREAGLGKILLGAFFKFGFRCGFAQFFTKKIEKPVLSLLLQKFGFKPRYDAGYLQMKVVRRDSTPASVDCATSSNAAVQPNPQPPVLIYSNDLLRLKTVFSKSYLKTQNMRIITKEEHEAGEASGAIDCDVVVNSAYCPPDDFSETVVDLCIQDVVVLEEFCSVCFHAILAGPLLTERDLER
mmetsp:Transcript_73771/g.123229  ORF Transcript_73771/g.123229 Transcript_73771/m.123229 type:complete len:343 (+) Transcript_73771:55-1083(+)